MEQASVPAEQAPVLPAPAPQMTERDMQMQDLLTDSEALISTLSHENALYTDILDLLKSGDVKAEIRNRCIIKSIDEIWVRVIEETLPALDRIMRRPSRYIEETDHVLPIEQSRNITSRSIRDLAQHSDYIKEVKGDTITPSKILNVFRDETIQTYENKFVNTLIQRLYLFISRRYTNARELKDDEKSTQLTMTSNFSSGEIHGKLNFSLEVTEPPSSQDEIRGVRGNSGMWGRVIKLNEILIAYTNSPFCREMGKNYIRPPVLHTNAINKNPDLRECLALWEFIESYEDVGYEALINESVEKTEYELVNKMYETLVLQYAAFRCATAKAREADITEDAPRIRPKYVPRMERTNVKEFDICDTIYERVITVGSGIGSAPRHKLSDEERNMILAIDAALEADLRMEEQKRLMEALMREREQSENATSAMRAERIRRALALQARVKARQNGEEPPEDVLTADAAPQTEEVQVAKPVPKIKPKPRVAATPMANGTDSSASGYGQYRPAENSIPEVTPVREEEEPDPFAAFATETQDTATGTAAPDAQSTAGAGNAPDDKGGSADDTATASIPKRKNPFGENEIAHAAELIQNTANNSSVPQTVRELQTCARVLDTLPNRRRAAFVTRLTSDNTDDMIAAKDELMKLYMQSIMGQPGKKR